MRSLLALLLLVPALAGCNGADGVTFETPPMEGDSYVILMTADFRFVPANAQVPANSTILFRNEGGFHNVESTTDAWEAGDVSDEDFELHIPVGFSGDYPYHCTPHKSLGMKGTLRIIE